jgi:ABC-type dipeptide/oligopeptide/nickel transport system permease subunit
MTSALATLQDQAAEEAQRIKQRSLWNDAVRKFTHNHLALAGLSVVTFVLLASIFGPMISPYDYARQDLFNVAKPPSADHWFGTDALGRDYLTRIMMGGRTAFIVAILVTGIAATVGMSVGAVAAYQGGFVDSLLMRSTEVVTSFPTVLLAMFIAGTVRPQVEKLTKWSDWLNKSSMVDYLTVFGALAMVSWSLYARLVRGQVLSLRQTEFIEAERMMGASNWRIIKNHLLPNAIGPVVVAISLAFGSAMLLESSLSFLGIGIQPPGASWGNMISESLVTWRQQPFLLAMPGIVLSIVVLACNFVGDGINDALNPRGRR